MSARFPEIRFRSREIVPEDGDRRLTITGDLTIRDAARQIRVAVALEGDESLAKNPETLTFSGQCSFLRQDFGLRWEREQEGGDLVGGNVVDVDLRINVRRGPK